MNLALRVFMLAVTCIAVHPAYACSGSHPVITVAPMAPVSYNGAIATGTMTVTIKTDAAFRDCMLGIQITSPAMTLQHAQSGAALNFSIASPFWFTGHAYLSQFQVFRNQTQTVSIPVHIPAAQANTPAGSYSRAVNVRVINTVFGGNLLETTQWFSATVPTSCILNPPSPAVLDFSAAIVNGLVPTPFQRSVTFANSGCNGPAKLTLSGEPMRLHHKTESAIPYTATAILGHSAVTLDTRHGFETEMGAITAPESGNIPLTITIPANQTPLQPGTYSSFLRTTLEPAQ